MLESKSIVILGTGGHAKVLINVLQLLGANIWGCTEPDKSEHGKLILGVEVRGSDNLIDKLPASSTLLVNAVGMVKTSPNQRLTLFNIWKKKGYSFASVIHPSAVIAKDVALGEGVQIMAGAVLQPGVSVSDNSIVNSSSSLDHDCKIGAHVHLAPGVTLSGNCKIGDGAMLGTGAVVIQGITIGAAALVGAGAVVVSDVASGSTVIGVPARTKTI